MKLGLTWRQPLGRPECPYMYRWALSLGPKGPSLRLHHWIRSDDKRFKHDHPADFITLVLKGSYTDLGEGSHERMTPGRIRKRVAEHSHTVAVDPGGCWTLCFFFPDRRRGASGPNAQTVHRSGRRATSSSSNTATTHAISHDDDQDHVPD